MTGLVGGPGAVLDSPAEYDHRLVYVITEKHVDCHDGGGALPSGAPPRSTLPLRSCTAISPVDARTGRPVYGIETYSGAPLP